MLDFGQVCLRSITTKNLNIVNNLDRHVLVIAEVSFLQNPNEIYPRVTQLHPLSLNGDAGCKINEACKIKYAYLTNASFWHWTADKSLFRSEILL